MAAMLLSYVQFLERRDRAGSQSPQMPYCWKGNTAIHAAAAAPSVSQAARWLRLFGNEALNIHMCEFDAKVLPPGTLCARSTAIDTGVGYIQGARRTLGRLSNYATGTRILVP